MKFLLLSLAAICLAACGHAPSRLPNPSLTDLSTEEGAKQATDVRLSSDCRRFTKQVEHPKVVGLNAKVAWKAADHVISQANGRLQKADDCIAQQVEAYAPGSAKRD